MLKLKQELSVSEHGTDWDHLSSVTDDDIERAVARDPDSAPILTEEEMRKSYKPHPPRIER